MTQSIEQQVDSMEADGRSRTALKGLVLSCLTPSALASALDPQCLKPGAVILLLILLDFLVILERNTAGQVSLESSVTG